MLPNIRDPKKNPHVRAILDARIKLYRQRAARKLPCCSTSPPIDFSKPGAK